MATYTMAMYTMATYTMAAYTIPSHMLLLSTVLIRDQNLYLPLAKSDHMHLCSKLCCYGQQCYCYVTQHATMVTYTCPLL